MPRSWKQQAAGQWSGDAGYWILYHGSRNNASGAVSPQEKQFAIGKQRRRLAKDRGRHCALRTRRLEWPWLGHGRKRQSQTHPESRKNEQLGLLWMSHRSFPCPQFVTVNELLLVTVPADVVTLMEPVVVPNGTVTINCVALADVTAATTPLNFTVF